MRLTELGSTESPPHRGLVRRISVEQYVAGNPDQGTDHNLPTNILSYGDSRGLDRNT